MTAVVGFTSCFLQSRWPNEGKRYTKSSCVRPLNSLSINPSYRLQIFASTDLVNPHSLEQAECAKCSEEYQMQGNVRRTIEQKSNTHGTERVMKDTLEKLSGNMPRSSILYGYYRVNNANSEIRKFGSFILIRLIGKMTI